MTRTETAWGPWEPTPLADVAALFSAARVPWWIAGGHAIDLAVGRTFREHADIDVLLLREDQLAVQEVLPDWEWWAADPPGTLRPWKRGELLPFAVQDIWCRADASGPWRIQIMLDESRGEEWVSRRSPRVRRPIPRLGTVSVTGIPYLVPEVQLFYKADQPRPKDERDFEEALPALSHRQRTWLADAIAKAYGSRPWLDRLRC